MIAKCKDGSFVISSHKVWVPGVYKDKKAARYAFQFMDGELQELQDKITPRSITTEDLKELRKLNPITRGL